MLSHLDVISLDRAKLYLKIDSLQTETDDEISSMIKSSLSFIEKRTGHIFLTKNKTYYSCALTDSVIVYDYPIDNSVTLLNIQYRQTNAIVPTINGSVTLTLGYTDIDEVPNELIDAALQLINFWFYNSETKNAMNTIPDFVTTNIDICRRFV